MCFDRKGPEAPINEPDYTPSEIDQNMDFKVTGKNPRLLEPGTGATKKPKSKPAVVPVSKVPSFPDPTPSYRAKEQ